MLSLQAEVTGRYDHAGDANRLLYTPLPVALTAQETRLLGYFLHHPGSILTKTELTEHVYGYNEERDSNTLEVFVGRLRKKLGSTVIETVRGQGYRLAGPRDEI